ncbi:MAG: type II secretion system F family protein [Eubacteriales bacterium]|nr:type II secretion system F family protein [Eubacteriales bacterium]
MADQTIEERKKNIRKLSADELAAFSGQMSLVISAGLPAIEGLEIMRNDAENRGEKEILDIMLESIRSTGSLSSAMQDAGAFPAYMVGMVHTGEMTGNLDSVMARMESHYQRESALRGSIYQAVVYPVILSVMVVAVILILVVQVMPVFDRIYSELGTELTGLPLVLSRIGNSVSGSGFVILVIVLAIAVIMLIMGRTESGYEKLRSWEYRLPCIRNTRHAESALRFASHMGLIFSSGLTVDEGLDMAEGIDESPYFKEMLSDCRKLMDDGATFSDALRQSGMFSGICAQLIETGSRTGNMDDAMEKVADICQDELDSLIDRRMARLEPALVIIMSAVVGGILLSVIVPLMNIMSAL